MRVIYLVRVICEFPQFLKIPSEICIKLHKYPTYSIAENMPHNQGFLPATITKKLSIFLEGLYNISNAYCGDEIFSYMIYFFLFI